MIIAQAVRANLPPLCSPGEAEAVEGRVDAGPVQILRERSLASVRPIVLGPGRTLEVAIAPQYRCLIGHQLCHFIWVGGG